MDLGPSYADLCKKVTKLKDENTQIAIDAAIKLNRYETKYRAILESVDAHLIIVNHNLKIIWANKSAREFLGDSIFGKKCHEVCQGSRHPCGKNKCLVQDAFRTGKTQKCETQLIDLKGQKRYFNGAAHVVLKDSKGVAKAVVKVFRDITQQKKTELALNKRLKQLRKNLSCSIKAMAMTVETRDPYTAGHQNRTSNIARIIATHMKLSGREIDGIRMAGVIHDLGKICVPSEILSKPQEISAAEYNLIKHHPQAGYDIIKGVDFNFPIADIVLQHHERFDGSGYPNGLKNDQIRIEAKIIGVADVIEAMSSSRPYRPSLGAAKAFSEIIRNSGKLYDPDVVDAAIMLYKEQELNL